MVLVPVRGGVGPGVAVGAGAARDGQPVPHALHAHRHGRLRQDRRHGLPGPRLRHRCRDVPHRCQVRGQTSRGAYPKPILSRLCDSLVTP